MSFKALKIGNLIAKKPIIQGGMGVGVSLSGLASAVAREGGVGIISAAQIGFESPDFARSPLKANLTALAYHIKKAKEAAEGGIVGVNVMCALRGYEEYIKCCVENDIDLIISGAGLPLKLPELVKGSSTKIAPIVSSAKAADILLKLWNKRYQSTADLLIIEGPKAGGHLGFKPEDIAAYANGEKNYDDEVIKIIDVVKGYETLFNKQIPVVFAGGVYDKSDIEHYLALGCSGVQMGTRFVATIECDAPQSFKEAYVQSTKENIGIVKSPLGMPGRAIINNFAKKEGRTEVDKCFACITQCDRETIPYCITQFLINAAEGDVQNSLLFCGENAYRIKEIVTVKELMKELCD